MMVTSLPLLYNTTERLMEKVFIILLTLKRVASKTRVAYKRFVQIEMRVVIRTYYKSTKSLLNPTKQPQHTQRMLSCL